MNILILILLFLAWNEENQNILDIERDYSINVPDEIYEKYESLVSDCSKFDESKSLIENLEAIGNCLENKGIQIDRSGQQILFSEAVEKLNFDCENLSFLYFEIGKRINKQFRLATVPGHTLIIAIWKKDTVFWETTYNKQKDQYHYQYYHHFTDESIKNGYYLTGFSEKEANSLVLTSLAYHFLEKGEYENSIEICRKAIDQNNHYVFPFETIGYSYLQLKMYDSARKYFEIVLNINQISVDALFNLAYLHLMLENSKMCLDYCSKLEMVDDKIPDIYLFKTQAFLDIGERDKACLTIRKGISLGCEKCKVLEKKICEN